MYYLFLTAVGVGGATVFGAVLGFAFKRAAERFGDIILAFASGIMLAASVFSLVIPSVEYARDRYGTAGVAITVAGIFAGALCLSILDRISRKFEGRLQGDDGARVRGVLLFVLAIAIHNLPEGLAAGVSFGSGNLTDTVMIAGSIALQNIPEGMVIISPMLAIGMAPKKVLLIAFSTGLVEVIGTLIGYFAISISATILSPALAFAAGTMLYVIADDMIPKTHNESTGVKATYSLLLGFALMVVFDSVL